MPIHTHSTRFLAASMATPAAGRDPAKLSAAMDANWAEIYGLADLIAARHVRTGTKSAFIEPVVDRLRPAGTAFDSDWMARDEL